MTATDVGQQLAERRAAGTPDRPEPTVFDLIRRQRDQIARALPRALDPDRFLRVVLTEVRRTPRLADCDPRSLLGSMMVAAQLGLEPGPLGHAYLVPYKREATLIVGYRGMIDLATRGGRVLSVDAHVVYEQDRFDFAYGTSPHLEHRPALADRGEPVCVYAVAQIRDGGTMFRVLPMADVEARRARSQSANSSHSPWKSDWAAMCRKSAVRALAPYLPMSVEFAAALAIDETAPTRIGEHVEDVIDLDRLGTEEIASVEPDGQPAQDDDRRAGVDSGDVPGHEPDEPTDAGGSGPGTGTPTSEIGDLPIGEQRIEQILAWAGNDPTRLQSALEAEQARPHPRSTLVAELADRLEPDETDREVDR